jgi:hypothetical protein
VRAVGTNECTLVSVHVTLFILLPLYHDRVIIPIIHDLAVTIISCLL